MTYRLDRLYRLGAWGAAACMLTICAIVTFQVLLRCLDALLLLVGNARLGLEIPGVSEMAAYLLVGATFLSMAYTFTHYAHIRVTLVISRLPPRARVWVETLCLLVSLALSVLLTWELVGLVRESLEYNDVSSGLLAIPLWIPQSVLVVGIALMCMALLETLLGTLRTAFTAPASYVAPELQDGDS
ncbi:MULTISPECIES: TRAP transporter small permease [Chromohalobacter]|uniref:TRAP transporter small permease protein n=2 Tax=Chromohalobacter TaxID=42054 RepID=A0A9X3B4K2_9GAMM|nr:MULTISPECIES: TRAP transporter small permease [Chromohalobacter]MCK0768542.1 TRAP transporter small permease [Chromohalobacter canadensis]MCT8467491.1 TRAP transporter small permease [Chromohalobacter canadensis]MCT8470761.1 TRAP transporter small permease [Chromohalobacter canadensis]MCT8497988.1 TRAP transporter small permease [Chromohalobacter canadensis]MCT8504328.1 TRAP transporter small permease [Chromohalobacter moromii]